MVMEAVVKVAKSSKVRLSCHLTLRDKVSGLLPIRWVYEQTYTIVVIWNLRK